MPITNNDISAELQAQVKTAIKTRSPVYIHGGNSKLFYGNPVEHSPLDISKHAGIIDYEPTELCITVRAGTRIDQLEKLLAENNQIMSFEPPQYSQQSTIGGAIAAGISGPARAYTGSVRDAILGVKIINGEGEIVNFGGQVMKNVAGYDLSRLMVRSQGTLGVILEVSIRLLPKPANDITVGFNANQEEALAFFSSPQTKQLPVTGSIWFFDQVYLRLSGSEKVIEQSRNKIDAELLSESNDIWQEVRDHKHHFFGRTDKPLWRLSLPPASNEISRIDDNLLIEWGGAQRWVNSNIPANIIHSIASSRNGYVTLFREDLPETPRFSKLEENLMKLHRQLKNKMDPYAIFNPGRIYEGL